MPTGVKAVCSERGASRQRNRGTQALSTNIDIVVFLDDDMILHRDYLRGIESIFAATPDAALIMGHLIINGGVSIGRAFELADCPADSTHYDVKQTTFGDVYGCNMCVRFDVAVAEPFDERLPLYSYMEDVDFGTRVRRHGHIGYYYGSLAVHLRTSEGRVSHRALGFSEVMNPAYLASKGTLPRLHALSNFIIKKPLSNLARLITGPERVQRRERFIGNCIALRHMLAGRLDPGQVSKIEVYTALNSGRSATGTSEGMH
jgi:GT2 family glycosyltransferase